MKRRWKRTSSVAKRIASDKEYEDRARAKSALGRHQDRLSGFTLDNYRVQPPPDAAMYVN